MIRVDKLITLLQKFPPDAHAYACEREITAIVVMAPDKNRILGEILASESEEDEGAL
jgi:hypothetical protein